MYNIKYNFIFYYTFEHLKRRIYYKIELNIININNYIKWFTYTQLN